MQIEFLGTASSLGVPEIGCACAVCRSADARDRRYRTSLRVRHGALDLVVDTPPEFRLQCLRAGIGRLDAVLLTHLHADHVSGIDDLRKFNRLQQNALPVYVPDWDLPLFRRLFRYALVAPPPGLTRPQFAVRRVSDRAFTLAGLRIQPVRVHHGAQDIRGYLFSADGWRVAYLTDCKDLPPASRELVHGADVVIMGALWTEEVSHPGHLCLPEAVALATQLGGRTTYYTHLTHRIGLHTVTAATLPPGHFLAWDGLVVASGAGAEPKID